jgi:hypothetical protein
LIYNTVVIVMSRVEDESETAREGRATASTRLACNMSQERWINPRAK